MQKLASIDTRKKKKHKKRKRGNTQVDIDSCHPQKQQDTARSHDLALQTSSKLSNKVLNSKLPSMGMSVIRQQSQQSCPTGQHQLPLPTSTKSEKKVFVHTPRLTHHGRRRRRPRSSEEEPQETTPSLSPSSSTGRVSNQDYECDDYFDDHLIANVQGNLLFINLFYAKTILT